MGWSEIVFGLLLVLGLLGLSLYVGARQVVQLRHLRQQDLPAEEMHYERRKAWRRLVSCGLTLVLAAMLAVLVPSWEEVDRMLRVAGPQPTEEQKSLARLYVGGWIVLMMLLMVLLVLAALDLWSTRRFGLRQFRKLQADRRAMIERQVNRMRRDRDGEE